MQRTFAVMVLATLSVARPTSAQGNPAGAEFQINTFSTMDQYFPAVAADPSGNFVVVWHSEAQDGSLDGIFGQRYASSGAPLGPEFRINTETADNQRHASVAMDSSGNFVVVWASTDQDGSFDGVFGQRYAGSGTPLGPEFRVNSYTPFDQGRPSVAFDSSGEFVVVWESKQNGMDYDVFGQRFAGSGAPLGPEFRVNTYTTLTQNSPVVAYASGSFVVVWESIYQDGSFVGVFGQRYAGSGAPLGPEFRVNSYTTFNQYRPSVASDSSGNFVVVWYSFQGPVDPGAGVFGQRYDSSGAPLGPEFHINTYTPGSQYNPSVTADPAGDFVVVWEGAPGGDVFGQRFASSGVPLGPEFRVNTYTTDLQRFSSVATDSSGNFVVVWNSMGQDGSYFGVFGQRYGQIVSVDVTAFSVE